MKRFLIYIITLFTTAVISIYLYNYFMHHQLDKRKQVAISFLDAVVNKKNYKLAEKYMGNNLIQHDPEAADGKEQIKSFIDYLSRNFPDSQDQIKQVYAEGDYVIILLHSVREQGTLGRAIVHIFKIAHNKVVEHWEVTQNIPKKSLNKNTMF